MVLLVLFWMFWCHQERVRAGQVLEFDKGRLIAEAGRVMPREVCETCTNFDRITNSVQVRFTFQSHIVASHSIPKFELTFC